MKKLILSASFAFALLTTSNTFAQQGFGTNQPDKSAAVDIVSSKRGLLIPRISIADLDQAAPVHQPAHSLFVFNTNATTGQGFYYWEKANPTSDVDFSGKWVRFTSSINEKDVIVAAGDNVQVDPTTSTDGLTTTYTVGVQGGSKDGQVLVTKIDNTDPANPITTTEWVDPNTFVLDVLTAGNAIGIAADPNDPTKVEVKFNGTLSENTTIATGSHDLAITGLGAVNAMTADDKLVIMDENGLLKTISKTDLVDAKNMTSTGGIITLNGATAVNNSVLAGVELGIADRSIDPGKFKAEDTDEGKVPVVKNDGTVEWTTIPGTNSADLTTDGKIVIGNNTSTTQTLADAVLVATQLSIKENSLTAAEIATGAVTSDEILDGTIQNADIADKTIQVGKLDATGQTEGHVATVNADGTVSYKTITPGSLTDKKTLTTDGVIVIGADSDATATTAAESVLADVKLNIGKDKITADHIATGAVTSDEILDGTIQVTDIKAPGTTTDSSTGGTANQVMVTDQNGNVTWVNQSDLGNKDSYTGIGAIDITANGTSTNGINYDVSVATATGTTLGVVKEAATDPTVNINAAGELAVNLTNTVLAGDVTGPLNTTKVEKIQGTAVSATPPTAINNVLVYDNANQEWIPTELTGDHITGKALSSTSITVTPETGTTNTALLEALNIEITPATEEGLVLTTTGTAGNLTTSWEKPTASYSTTNVNIAGDTNYSPYIAEIILTVQLGNTDETVAFPTASAENEGQTISIKITNDNEAHTGYLNVLNTYGSMPYQGWIVKSNGSAWIIVGRN